MSVNRYFAGQLADVTNTPGFMADNELIDPDTVQLIVGQDQDSATTYTFGTGSEIEKVSTGLYTANIDTTGFASGVWWYEWVGSGNIQALQPNYFVVDTPVVG